MQLYLVFLAAAGSARSLKIAVLLRRVYGVGSSRKFTVMPPMVMSAALSNPLPERKRWLSLARQLQAAAAAALKTMLVVPRAVAFRNPLTVPRGGAARVASSAFDLEQPRQGNNDTDKVRSIRFAPGVPPAWTTSSWMPSHLAREQTGVRASWCRPRPSSRRHHINPFHTVNGF